MNVVGHGVTRRGDAVFESNRDCCEHICEKNENNSTKGKTKQNHLSPPPLPTQISPATDIKDMTHKNGGWTELFIV
jgi:hypothetical protein